MKMRLVFFTTLIFLFLGCKDIFTTNVLESYQKDASEMTTDELSALLSATPLSDISDEDLALAETALEESRIDYSDELSDALKEQYVEETTQLLAINMEQANVEGLISDLLAEPVEGAESVDFVDSLLADTDRLDNMEEASAYAVDAFLVDPDSLTTSELVVGSVGLVSDVLQDEDKADALSSISESDPEDFEAALEAAVTDSGEPAFTAEEIENIQTAQLMMDAAESSSGEDSPLASLFGGLPF